MQTSSAIADGSGERHRTSGFSAYIQVSLRK